SWNICGPEPALATSSTGQPLAPLSHCSVWPRPAPRAISTSPSGWNSTRPPMGATATGHASGTPSSVEVRSTLRTSTSTFCWMARRSRWRRLRRLLDSVSAVPSPKFQWSRGSFSRAARRISGSVTNLGPDGVEGVMGPYYTASFDDPVRAQPQRFRDHEPERPGRLEVDDQLERRGLLDGKLGGPGALEDLVGGDGESLVDVTLLGAVARQAAGHRVLAPAE